jgi:hypothetical protein
MFSCGSVATVGLMQLRPGYLMRDSASAEPLVVLLAVCKAHARPARAWLRETWPHEDVDTYGLEFLHRTWAAIEGMLEDTETVQLVPEDLAV